MVKMGINLLGKDIFPLIWRQYKYFSSEQETKFFLLWPWVQGFAINIAGCYYQVKYGTFILKNGLNVQFNMLHQI